LRKWVRRRPAKSILLASGLFLALVLVGSSLLLASLKQAHDAEAKRSEERQEAIRQKDWGLRQLHYADDIAQAWQSWKDRRPVDQTNTLENYRLPSGQIRTDDPRGFEWYYLSHLTHAGTRVSRYTALLFCLAFSPDGATCATGHRDGAIVLWDTASGQQRAILKEDQTASGQRREILPEHTPLVYRLAYSPDGSSLVSGLLFGESGNAWGELRLWDVRKRKVIPVFADHWSTIYSVAYSPDGRTLAAAIQRTSDPAEIKLWAMPSGELRHSIPLPARTSATSLSFTSDSAILALGLRDGTISLCEVATGRVLETRSGHQNSVFAVACGHKDAVLVSGAKDGWVRLWSLRPGGSLLAEYPHEGRVTSVAFSPDDRSVASIGDKIFRVWDRQKQREHFSRAVSNAVYGTGSMVAFSPDGKTLALGSEDGRLWINDLARSEDGRLSM
jgi:WD40 repeat protein